MTSKKEVKSETTEVMVYWDKHGMVAGTIEYLKDKRREDA